MIRVLYVDDEPVLLDIGKEFLEASGQIQVDIFSSVVEARHAFSNGQYEAIISDYEMPEISGLDFLKGLRSMEVKTPFILFTGRGREEVVIEALNLGADFYLQKGGDPEAQFAELEHSVKTAVQRRRTEVAIHENEERYRFLLDESSDPISSFRHDGTYLYINRAFERGIGLPAGSILGHRLWDVFPREEADERFRAIKEAFSKGVENRVQVGVRRPEGRHFYFMTVTPIKDNSGLITTVICSSKDITDLKMAEDAMRSTEEMYQQAFSQLPVPAELYDSGGHIVMINPAGLAARGREASDPGACALSDYEVIGEDAWRELRSGKPVVFYACAQTADVASGGPDADGRVKVTVRPLNGSTGGYLVVKERVYR